MKRAVLVTLVLALMPAMSAAHDSGVDVMRGHGQIVNLTLGTLPAPVTPPENVSYVTGDNGFTGGHVVTQGDRLYLGSYGRGLHIYDISDPEAPRRIGAYTPGLRADTPPDAIDVGGRRFAVLNGTRRTHSALPGEARTDRTEWLDVTDASAPRVLHTFGPDQVDGESHNGDIVDSLQLYVPSGGIGGQGLRIYDISPTVTTPASECRDGDPANPCKPQNLFRGDPGQLWADSPHRGSKPVGAPFTHTHDVEIYPAYPVRGMGRRDIMLLAEGGNYLGTGDTGSMFVIDITDPGSPVVLQRWLHAQGSGHHPIRYHHEAQFLDSDPRVVLVTDEDMHNGCGAAGGVTAVRLSPDLKSSRELSEWFIPAGTPAPVCSVHVFSSEGSRVFIGSYNAGLQVVDYGNPAEPRQVGEYIAEGTTAWGALAHRGVVYVGDMTRGLDVYRYEGGQTP
jgi:hypothetical protein